MLLSPRTLFSTLQKNTRNNIIHFDRTGLKHTVAFNDFYRDVMCAIHHLCNNHLLGSNKRIVICGQPGYEWLKIATACILSDTVFIALPETLKDDEISASLDGIHIDGVVADNEFRQSTCFRSTLFFSFDEISAFENSFENLENYFKNNEPDFSNTPYSLIAFTSGSTASKRLKAFPVSLESMLTFTKRFTDIYNITAQDNWLICHSFSHIVHFEYALGGLFWGYDITLCGVFRLLMQGAELAPSVVITVPTVYEKIAQQIRHQYQLDVTALQDIEQKNIVDDNNNIIRHSLSDGAKAVMGSKLKMMLIGASPSPTSLQIFLLQHGLPLYEGYGMSETNMISCNTPTQTSLSTTGQAWPGIELTVDENQCVLVKATPTRSTHYLNASAEENATTFLADGWVNTGDLGELDAQGYLKIIGRKKDIIINAGGKNINPSAIETRLTTIPAVAHAVVYGDEKPYLVAVLAPEKATDIPTTDTIQEYIQAINLTLPYHEKVLAFFILDKPLNENDGTLTRSGKPRRKNIIDIYQRNIQALYS